MIHRPGQTTPRQLPPDGGENVTALLLLGEPRLGTIDNPAEMI
ncbi:MAG: hypothetical protein AB2807_10845 [Candidatus Sedimenticola endophacoides]